MRIALCVAAALLVSCRLLVGQVVGTQCWTTPSGMTQCNTQPGVMYNPNANAFSDAMAQLRNSLAQMAYMRQVREQAKQQAQTQAQQRAEFEARQQAALELYRDRAWAVVKHLADSLMLSDVVGRQFLDSVGPTLVNVYLVNPAATREEIAAALWPRTQAIGEQFTAFIARVVPPIKPAIDSLDLSVDQKTAFIDTLFVWLRQAFMAAPGADADSVRARVQPLFDQARIAAAATQAPDTTVRQAPGKPRRSRHGR